MTDQAFLATTKQLKTAESELKSAQRELVILRKRLSCIGSLEPDLVFHDSFGLCVPSTDSNSGLATVAAWPTRDELVAAWRQEHGLQRRVADLQHAVDDALK